MRTGLLVITASQGLNSIQCVCNNLSEAHPAVSVPVLSLWACLDNTLHRLHIYTLMRWVNIMMPEGEGQRLAGFELYIFHCPPK